MTGYIAPDEIARALALLQSRSGRNAGWADTRHRCSLLLRFLWLTGCRISEALGCDASHLDLHLGVVRLETLKKKKETWRALPLPGEFLAALAALGPGRLFPWTRPHGYKLIRRALEAAGVDSARAHPRAIRHGHGVHAAKSNVPLPVIQRVLGHASLSTTTVYLEVTGKDVERAYALVDW